MPWKPGGSRGDSISTEKKSENYLLFPLDKYFSQCYNIIINVWNLLWPGWVHRRFYTYDVYIKHEKRRLARRLTLKN